MNVPGRWSSASEGIWGSYPEGNLSTIRYGSLESLMETYEIADVAKFGEFDDFTNKPKIGPDGKLAKTLMPLDEFFKNPQQDKDVVLF